MGCSNQGYMYEWVGLMKGEPLYEKSISQRVLMNQMNQL